MTSTRKKNSQLGAATTIAATDGFTVNQPGVSRRATRDFLLGSNFNVKHYGAAGDGVTDDSSTIQSAVDAANSAGGGVVYIPQGIYKINSAITLKDGVFVQGAGFTVSKDGLRTTDNEKGTILKGSTTNACFVYNETDNGADYASSAVMLADAISGCGVIDLAFTDFTYAIKIGAKYATGCLDGLFRNLWIANCYSWALWCENCQHSRWEFIRYSQLKSGAEGGAFFGASTKTYNHGNNTYTHIFGQSNLEAVRGIVFIARAGAKFNDLGVYKLQCNQNAAAKVAQAATMSSGSANITVTDGTKFPLDMPVSVSADANGFIQYQTYFVVSQVSNTIQLSNFMRGSAINATGTTAVNVERFGFPCLEIVAHDDDAAAQIQPSYFTGVDLEGNASTILVSQNTDGVHIDLNYVNTGQDSKHFSTMTVRNMRGTFRATSLQPWVIDSDSRDLGLFSLGVTLDTANATKPVIQRLPVGFYHDPDRGKTALNAAPFFHATEPLAFVGSQWAHNAYFVYPELPFGQRCKARNTTTLTMDARDGGCIVFTGTSNSTWTLPLLNDGNPGEYNASSGLPFEIANGSTSAVTLTLNANTGDNFNRQSGKTSYSLAQGTSISVRANHDGTTAFWQVTGNAGAV